MSDKRSLTVSSNAFLFAHKRRKCCVLNIEKIMSLLAFETQRLIESRADLGLWHSTFFDGFFSERVDFYLKVSSEKNQLKFAKLVPSVYFQFAEVNRFLRELYSDYAHAVSTKQIAHGLADFQLRFNSYLMFDLADRRALAHIDLPALPGHSAKLAVGAEVQTVSSKFALHSHEIFENVRQSHRVMNYVFCDQLFLLDTTNLIENENALVLAGDPPECVAGITLSGIPLNDSIGKFSFGFHVSARVIEGVFSVREGPVTPPPSEPLSNKTGTDAVDSFWMRRTAMVVADDSTYSSAMYVCNGFLVTVEHGVGVESDIKVLFYVDAPTKERLSLHADYSFAVVYQARVVHRDKLFDCAVLKLDKSSLRVKRRRVAYEAYKSTANSKDSHRLKQFLKVLDAESHAHKQRYLGETADKSIKLLGFPEFKAKDFANCCVSSGDIMKAIRIDNDPEFDGTRR